MLIKLTNKKDAGELFFSICEVTDGRQLLTSET